MSDGRRRKRLENIALVGGIALPAVVGALAALFDPSAATGWAGMMMSVSPAVGIFAWLLAPLVWSWVRRDLQPLFTTRQARVRVGAALVLALFPAALAVYVSLDRAPELQLVVSTATGELGAEFLESYARQLNAQAASLARCYGLFPSRPPEKRVFETSWSLGPDGDVSAATVEHGSRPFRDCVAAAIAGWHFAPGPSAGARLHARFLLLGEASGAVSVITPRVARAGPLE